MAARKRMIDPGIWTSEDFSNLSMLARLIWIGLISNADDEGRGKANSAYLKSQLFPYDDELALKKIDNALIEIEKTMSIHFYEVEGKKYYQLTKWEKFQTINRPSPSQIPKQIIDCSQNIPKQINEHSLNNHKQDTDCSLPKKEIEIESKNECEEESEKEESAASALSTRPQKHKYGKFKNVLLTEEEYNRLIAEVDGVEALEYFSEYRERKGYKCKSDNLSIRKWAFDAVREERQRTQKSEQFVSQQAVSQDEVDTWK